MFPTALGLITSTGGKSHEPDPEICVCGYNEDSGHGSELISLCPDLYPSSNSGLFVNCHSLPQSTATPERYGVHSLLHSLLQSTATPERHGVHSLPPSLFQSTAAPERHGVLVLQCFRIRAAAPTRIALPC